MAGADEIRDAQRATWATLSGSWDRWDELITEQLRPVGVAMVDALGVAEGQEHLDVASGTGQPGLSIAKLAPEGRVVLTDLAPEMLDIAARRAAAQGATNVETVVCSADDLPFDAGAFDSISVRFGYMFFPDLPTATAEFVRVLRPGGRVCAAVWAAPEANPWTATALNAVGTEFEVRPPSPEIPGMFRCAAPGLVGAMFEAAGLRDVREWEVEVELVVPTPEHYWDVISEHASVVAAALRQVDATARDRIRERTIAGVSAFATNGEIRVPGLARCTVGSKELVEGMQ